MPLLVPNEQCQSTEGNRMLVHGQVAIIFVVSVGLFVQKFFSAVFDAIFIKLGHMFYVWV